jgi:hypothetical protein
LCTFAFPKKTFAAKKILIFRKVLVELFQKLAGFLRAAPLSRAVVNARNLRLFSPCSKNFTENTKLTFQKVPYILSASFITGRSLLAIELKPASAG